MLTDISRQEPTRSADAAPDEYSADSQDAAPDVEEALTQHLSRGRRRSDLGHGVLALVAAFVFWGHVSPALILLWLAVFGILSVVRTAYRHRVTDRIENVSRRLKLLRWDVWSSAALWAFWSFVLVGSPYGMTAMLTVLIAGLVAAGTSTLVPDRLAFQGFLLLLSGPLILLMISGGASKENLGLMLLLVIYLPFMLSVHRQAHDAERTQLLTHDQLHRSQLEATHGQDFLRALMAHAPLSIIVLDHEHTILTANPAFADLTNVPLSDIGGRRLTELPQNEIERQSLERFLGEISIGSGIVTELRFTPADRDSIWIRLTGTRAAGMASGTTIILGEDVTEQVEAREAMAEARTAAEQAIRSKSSFLASMSHEIRTPMNGIIGMIGILLDTPLDEQQRSAARIVKRSADGLLRILNDILDASKIEAGQLDLEEMDIDLPGLVADVARIYMPTATAKGTELLVDVSGFVHSHFLGDPTRVTQVLNNLVSNAIKFTKGGEISLVALPLGDHHPDQNKQVTVRFSVRDSGIGIPAETIERIFQEFEQADQSTTRVYGGTGLGLSISRQLVELMGGHLEVASEVGVGSEFYFQLEFPIIQTPRGVRSEHRAHLDGRRFLVVDDNEAARQIVVNVLGGSGATVEEASDVDRGLTMLRSASASASPYDAVILDHLMPLKDGFDFAAAVHAEPDAGHPPLLMLTSSHSTGDLEKARDLGITGFLSKPIGGSDLVRALGTVLGHGGFDGSERRIVTRDTLAKEGSLRVLVAEDNLVNQQVALAMLRKRGYEVDIVENGKLAVEAVLSTAYDLVLMDLEMPEMDGLEATRKIRSYEQFASLPIIALTAHAFAEQREKCADAGMNDFITKPIQPAVLYEILDIWEARVNLDSSVFDPAPTADSSRPNSGSPLPSSVPVDIAGFRALMKEAGIESIVEPTLDVFLNETPKIFDGLRAAAQANDASGVNSGAHSLKSSSANIRADALADLLAELEQAGRNEDLEEVAVLLPRVESEFGAVLSFLGDRS